MGNKHPGLNTHMSFVIVLDYVRFVFPISSLTILPVQYIVSLFDSLCLEVRNALLVEIRSCVYILIKKSDFSATSRRFDERQGIPVNAERRVQPLPMMSVRLSGEDNSMGLKCTNSRDI